MCSKGKGARTREPLTQNSTDAYDGIAGQLKAAQIRNDKRMLVNIEGQNTTIDRATKTICDQNSWLN